MRQLHSAGSITRPLSAFADAFTSPQRPRMRLIRGFGATSSSNEGRNCFRPLIQKQRDATNTGYNDLYDGQEVRCLMAIETAKGAVRRSEHIA